MLYSLIATGKRHGLDPFAYPRDVIARISDHPTNKLHELLPDHWKLAAYYSAGVFARPTCYYSFQYFHSTPASPFQRWPDS